MLVDLDPQECVYIRYLCRRERQRLDKRRRGLTKSFGDEANFGKIPFHEERMNVLLAKIDAGIPDGSR